MKTRSPVAKNLRQFSKAVVHKDRKKAAKRGYLKHKARSSGLFLGGLFRCLLTGILLASAGLASADTPLGQFPLCEASSARIVACPDRQGDCLLVGDNEHRTDLFLFSLVQGEIVPASQRRLPLARSRKAGLSDIEALARLGDGRILVFGSHSRNTRCEARKKRRRLMEVKPGSDGAQAVRMTQSRAIACGQLFDKTALADARIQAVCHAIDRAEQAADTLEDALENRQVSADEAKRRCNDLLPFNAEGAVVIPTPGGEEVWIGLRAPLVAELSGQRMAQPLAMLLRMKGVMDYRFDRVALLDLGGRGIRDLAFARDRVWLIAGPAGDRDVPFELRSFAVGLLQGTAIIQPRRAMTLPSSAEGLAIQGDRATIVIDGDVGKASSGACERPSRYRQFVLPEVTASSAPLRQ